MKTPCFTIALLCLLVVPLSGQTTNQTSPQEQMRVWLDSNAPTQRRLEAMFTFIGGNEGSAALRQNYEANPKAVSDALVFSFVHGNAGHQTAAFYFTIGLQDRTAYSQMVEPALRSPNREARGMAMGAAAFFQDRSELVVSALLTELRSTNSPSNLREACSAAAKLEVQEAIEPMADLVANSSLARARGVAEALARYPSLPADVLKRLEAARARFEHDQAEADKRPKTAMQEALEKERKANFIPSEFELLLKALDKIKEKAQLPSPADATQPAKAAKKAGKPTMDGKTSPTNSLATQTDSPTSPARSSGAGGKNLLLFLGLASLAVIAWFLLKGRGQ